MGTHRSQKELVDFAEDHALVKVDRVCKRFRENVGKTIKESTKDDYEKTFRRFAEFAGLEQFSRAQLGGSKGRELIRRYLNDEIGLRSWGTVEAKLKGPWIEGLGLPWPLAKRDRPKLPPRNKTRTPADQHVRLWKDAAARGDAYCRVEFKMFGHLGLRPSHTRKVLWEDVKNEMGEVCWGRNENDVPFMIEADGYVRGFKNFAWVRAWVPHDLAADLSQWRAELGREWRPERPILPFRDTEGNVRPTEEQTRWAQRHRWDAMAEKWDLPKLVPRSFRKFVKSKCNEAGMDVVARSYLQGHTPPGMDGVYDNPEMKDLADRQMSRLPEGALGALKDPSVNVTDKVTKAEIDLIAAWKSGAIGDFDLFEGLKKLRTPKTSVEPSG